jgi:Cation transporter/ATPase, N-terminus
MGVDPDRGLDDIQVQRRLEEYGPNELPTEPPPSVWVVARGQLANIGLVMRRERQAPWSSPVFPYLGRGGQSRPAVAPAQSRYQREPEPRAEPALPFIT